MSGPDQTDEPGQTGDTGELLEILVYPARRAPAQQMQQVDALQDKGLDGDHPRGGKRQVTLLSIEAWQETMQEVGGDLPPSARRANLVVRGIDLEASMGRRIRMGSVELQIEGETTPCDLMVLQHAGLRQALEPKMRGGVFGCVIAGGQLTPGLSVAVLD